MNMDMTDAGREGSQIGTTLRLSLQRLAGDSKPVRKALAELGISIIDANGEMKAAPQLLAEVIECMQEMDGQTRIAAASTLFGSEAMSGMLEVNDAGPVNLNKLTAALRNTESASAKAAKPTEDNLAGSVAELGGAVETA